MYQFFIDGVLLPVAPEKLTTKIKNANKTLTLINEGEINFLKTPGLTEIDFNIIIPSIEYSFAYYANGFLKPKYFLEYFEKLKTSKKPFNFVVLRRLPNGNLLFDTDIKVSLESYSIEEGAKEGFDCNVSIKLKQYRDFKTNTLNVISENKIAIETQREQENSPAPKQETTYTIKSGDCLWNIAKKIYGNGSKYTKIYEANKDKITNPNLITVGQVLVIPSA